MDSLVGGLGNWVSLGVWLRGVVLVGGLWMVCRPFGRELGGLLVDVSKDSLRVNSLWI